MNKPYQLVLDFWEGNPDIDAKVCMENGVKGMIARLNDMNGGHHLDTLLAQNWEVAKQFPAQSLYFVYNPWVTGRTNYDWAMTHLPNDFGTRRLFVDIEVRYSGYHPLTYASEVNACMKLFRQNFPATRYSGGGYLDILTPWPTDEDYWWAAYSTALTNAKSWPNYSSILATLDYASFTKLSPGPCRMWQASGDGSRLPGFNKHAVDTSIFPGTLDDLIAWFNCAKKEPDQPFRDELSSLAARLDAVELILKNAKMME